MSVEGQFVILSAAKDLALFFGREGPNQGEMLRCAQHDREYQIDPLPKYRSGRDDVGWNPSPRLAERS